MIGSGEGAARQNVVSVPPGSVTVSVSARVFPSYRLVSSLATGAIVSVRVRAKIMFAATLPSDGLAGLVRPKALAGHPPGAPAAV